MWVERRGQKGQRGGEVRKVGPDRGPDGTGAFALHEVGSQLGV